MATASVSRPSSKGAERETRRHLLSGLLGLTVATSPAMAAESSPSEPALPSSGDTFGSYELVPLLDDGPPYAGPATPTSLADVGMTDQVDKLLTPEARARLAEQGFVIVPEQFRLFHQAYDEQYYSGTPVFVTTDAAYNAWHEVFDKTLRDLETRRLSPALRELLTGMLAERPGTAGLARRHSP